MFSKLLAFGVLAMMAGASVPEKVLVDTDPGEFSDDQHAAVMLLRSPEQVQVLGMTVVAGNTWAQEGYGYMRRALNAMRRDDVPIHIGAEAPLVHTAAIAKAADKRWGSAEFIGAFQRPMPANPAGASLRGVEFLIETIDRNPGQVTVLAIGPMTNIAIALRLRPDLERKIKRLVFMGGSYRERGNVTKAAEFNFWFDPEAARAVLRSAIGEKVMFGLDICHRAKLTKRHFDEIVAVKTPITELYRQEMGNNYPGFLKNPAATSPVWDALAADYLIDPGFVTKSEEAYLDVDAAFGTNYGAVVPLDRTLAPEATPVRIMMDLDFDRFFAKYKKLLTGP
jgi:inosine-uridine nucleoside N-ribohydrolase